MKHKISILFYVKSSKASKNGLTPIYQRITINGSRIELSTSKFVEKSKWNAAAGKMKGTNEEARLINSHLDILKTKVHETENWMINNNHEINVQTFKNKLLGIEEKQRKLILIFEDHNKKMKELIGKEFSINTYKKYETTLSHIKQFIQHQYSINDISIKQVGIAFINDFDFYLRNIKNCNNNSTIKYIRNFGKIIKQCYINDWIEKDPFLKYKGKVREVERIYLIQDEIESLLNKEFKIKRLELVRDMFIFSCFTGLAYIDVFNLTKSNIIIGIDGGKWISTHRQKTESASKIPILPVTQMVIDKYENVYADISFILHDETLFPLLKFILEDEKVRYKVLFGSDYYVVSQKDTEKDLHFNLRGYLGETLFELISNENPRKFLSTTIKQY